MPVMLQSCGKKTAKKKFLNGPDAPLNAVILNCASLPNPFKHLDDLRNTHGTVSRELDLVKIFLRDAAKDKVARLVSRGKAAVMAGKPVVAQCAFGKHRSRAVLEMIGDEFHPSKVYYVHREGT
jgi:RNase adaptor protein for sRNA GlmZ degradation